MKRSYTLEMMDDFSIKDNSIDGALAELKIINKLLGGNSVSQEGFDLLFKDNILDGPITVLDAGSGASDILLSIKYSIKQIAFYSLDMNLQACKYAVMNSTRLKVICGNIITPPIKNLTFDIAHASLFLHHFRDDDIKIILSNLLAAVKYGIVINDLRRSIPAFWGIKILTTLFSNSEMVRNDAPLSVRRGFVIKELKNILNELNIKRYVIKRKWAFRWMIVIYK